MLENNNETATATALLTHNELLMNENAVLKSEVERLSTAFANIREYIQASINRGEWDGELEEIFWEELALKLGLDLKLTEEVEVRILVSYYANITVPKGSDVTDYASWITVGDPELFSTEAEMDCVTFDEVEINLI